MSMHLCLGPSGGYTQRPIQKPSSGSSSRGHRIGQEFYPSPSRKPLSSCSARPWQVGTNDGAPAQTCRPDEE